MKVKVLHLYYDIMNLYGENGNIRMLCRRLEDQGLEVELHKKTITDNIYFMSYDVIYCGAGIESNRNVCLKHLLQYRNELKDAFNAGKVMLFTGNSYEMLGSSLTDPEGNEFEGIGIFSFKAVEQRKNRYTGDVILNSELFSKPFVGFINKCSVLEGLENSLFTVEKVIGTIKDTKEGVYKNNLFGTQLTGPVLVKNPHFAEYFTKLILKNLKVSEYIEKEYPYEQAGYDITIAELGGNKNV